MGGLRGGRGGGGGGGFEEESDSFDAMDDAKSLSDGCELFLGGGGGGGDESVGCCVVASMFSLMRGVFLVARRSASCDELCRAARCTATPLSGPLLSAARRRLGTAGLTHRALKQSSGLLCSDQCVSAARGCRGPTALFSQC